MQMQRRWEEQLAAYVRASFGVTSLSRAPAGRQRRGFRDRPKRGHRRAQQ
jgi:hypothetical protein